MQATAVAAEAEAQKRRAALAALEHVTAGSTIGVGTGSTVNCFIDALAAQPGSDRAAQSRAHKPAAHDCVPPASASSISMSWMACELYIDGADEATRARQLIKGGGGALTREKILAAAATRFVCIVDEAKIVATLGRFPLPVEVIPMARTLVARELTGRGGRPVWREGCVTDNGNHILDVHGLTIADPVALERDLESAGRHRDGRIVRGTTRRPAARGHRAGLPDAVTPQCAVRRARRTPYRMHPPFILWPAAAIQVGV